LILIIGYGNPLRGDDGIGQKIAQMLEERLQDKHIQVESVFQLTPEWVERISQAQFVVFIDAGMDGEVGTIRQGFVRAETGEGVFTHNVCPETLLRAALALYGAAPPGLLISIAGESFDYSAELSPQLERVLPELAEQVEAIIKDLPVVV